ncbi:hypothetical protein Lmor_2589 [Legionella moravica]|uniref:Uncharacterized protein n=1 Tax=Legionella moravica TaxID=39962 RepID=A0A378JW11_9GAMM|nr:MULTISPECIES: hypothetical protein [Legionella]KTD31713.1 hypothetical protein Lmor_2589 [Legionella moravica]RUR19279.1 hypothetical protein ELY21_05215 [Legionella sp. km535]STX62207.1 Uncharacterised protein [Legionella moravica]
MLLTLALVVFAGAIMILFSQEFIRTFKKIFAIKGAKLFLPLIIGSWLVLNFDYLCLWGIYYYREVLNSIVDFLAGFIPFPSIGRPVVLIIVLTAISVVPVVLLDVYLVKKTFKRYEYPYLTSTLIWIVTATMFLVVS